MHDDISYLLLDDNRERVLAQSLCSQSIRIILGVSAERSNPLKKQADLHGNTSYCDALFTGTILSKESVSQETLFSFPLKLLSRFNSLERNVERGAVMYFSSDRCL